MALSDIGHSFQGDIWYWVEDTFGGGESATTLPISKDITSVQISTGDKHKELADIRSPVAIELLEQPNKPTLRLEYVIQAGDTMLADTVNRTACGILQSLAFCITANDCLTGDDTSIFNVLGAKPSSVRVSGSKESEYTVAIDFECKSIVTAAAITGSSPTALTGDLCAFHIGGEITKTSGHVVDTDHIAFITESIELTINHNLTSYVDHDSLTCSHIVEGAMGITGSVDITLDGGGGMHLWEVLNQTEFTITVNTGDGAGSPIVTLDQCKWKSTGVTLDTSGGAMMQSAPFTSIPASMVSIVTAVEE